LYIDVQIATLLNKEARRTANVDVTYSGFDCPDEFVVGYGLDYAGRYRSLPYVGVLKPSVYGGEEAAPETETSDQIS